MAPRRKPQITDENVLDILVEVTNKLDRLADRLEAFADDRPVPVKPPEGSDDHPNA